MPNEICIENLGRRVDVSVLTSLFKKYGRILSCSIDVDNHFVSLGKGYISFDNPSSAQQAVRLMDGYMVERNKINVTLEPSDIDAKTKDIKEHFTKVHVKNISPTWDDCDLEEEFSKFGEVKSAQISMSEGKSNCYGFVVFNKHSDAKAAVEYAHTNLLVEIFIPKSCRKERSLSPESAREKLQKSVQFNNLHVKNIPKSMDDFELEQLFKKFGQITSVKVARDDKQQSKGFGFVCFGSEADAANARLKMNGYSLGPNNLVVNFNQKRDARQQYLAMKNVEVAGESSQKAKLRNAFQPKDKILFSFSSK